MCAKRAKPRELFGVILGSIVIGCTVGQKFTEWICPLDPGTAFGCCSIGNVILCV